MYYYNVVGVSRRQVGQRDERNRFTGYYEWIEETWNVCSIGPFETGREANEARGRVMSFLKRKKQHDFYRLTVNVWAYYDIVVSKDKI